MAQRIVLITGATGKQGGALIRALLRPTSPDSLGHEYHVYALTRHASSAAAAHLATQKSVTVVEGDLDNRDSISRVFRDAKVKGGIWGVFAVLAYPGLGVQADGEESQGKMLADVALEFGVEAYIYSSLARSGAKYEGSLKLSSKAKASIEQHCQALGKKGLPWIILRPGFFMENLNGFIGSIGISVFKAGLKPDTTIGLIASEDIGNVAAAVFKDHGLYGYKVLTLCAEFVTMSQLEESYRRAIGRSLPGIPLVMARALIKINSGTKTLIENIELVHHARLAGEYPELDTEIQIANNAYRMQSYYDWLLKERVDVPLKSGWNNLSIGKLLTGRS